MILDRQMFLDEYFMLTDKQNGTLEVLENYSAWTEKGRIEITMDKDRLGLFVWCLTAHQHKKNCQCQEMVVMGSSII